MSKIHPMFSFIIASLLLTIIGQSGSCRTSTKGEGVNKAPTEQSKRLAAGVWGGNHIRLEVTDSGASIEYDCANSTIDQPIVLDGKGNFDVKGKYTREHGGPVRRDEVVDSSPVRYVGRVNDKSLTLTITMIETKETIGTFNLIQGNEGRVMKCR